MAAFAGGDIVLVPFPFSVADGQKIRPAVVVALLGFGVSIDYLLALITAQKVSDPHIIELEDTDIEGGSLHRKSYIRPLYMFTVVEARVRRKVGTLTVEKMNQVLEKIRAAAT